MRTLNVTDPELFTIIHEETLRQEKELTLIASEKLCLECGVAGFRIGSYQ